MKSKVKKNYINELIYNADIDFKNKLTKVETCG